jgi:hypothetical protein
MLFPERVSLIVLLVCQDLGVLSEGSDRKDEEKKLDVNGSDRKDDEEEKKGSEEKKGYEEKKGSEEKKSSKTFHGVSKFTGIVFEQSYSDFFLGSART